ncbi:MAG TPA: LysE family transporter [Clostridiaceae bacterium]|jgi:threonine/homoserine/homoserine lactone efflux protein|nr:LysE family transporter [Clostridiaceae bacterium]
MNCTAFLSYVFLTLYTPGPNTIMSMTNAAKYGFRKSFPFTLGVFLGFFTMMLASAAFSSLLYRVIPAIKPVMLVIGAAYIMWLAWKVWRDKPRTSKRGPVETNTFASGLLLQFVNVKVMLFGITAMSSFVRPHFENPLILAAFALFTTFVGFSANISWGLFGAAFERLFKRHGRVLHGVMALLLVYTAVTMLLDLRG